MSFYLLRVILALTLLVAVASAATGSAHHASAATTFYSMQAENMGFDCTSTQTISDAAAQGGVAVKAWDSPCGVQGSATFATSGTYTFQFGGREDYYAADAHISLFMDLSTTASGGVNVTNTSGYSTYTITAYVAAGAHSFQLLFDNDAYGGTGLDRNAYFDWVTITDPSSGAPFPGITGTTYYVDCNGNDFNNGTSSSTPWQSLSKASAAPLNPGDGLLFKSGCTWNGNFTVSRSGNTTSPVVVGGYGTGSLPEITSNHSGSNIVNITGSYVTVDGLNAVATPYGYSSCGGQNVPEGWIAGFTLESGASHDKIQNSTVSGAQSAIYVVSGATYNTVWYDNLSNNTMYQQNPGSGAYGVALHGSYNTIEYNTINDNHQCSFNYGTDGAAVEVYAGSNNTIQYNTAHEDDAFSELTQTSANNANSNVFYYNLYWSDLSNSVFVNQHGGVLYTDLYNNTVYLTGGSSQGFLNASGSSMWLRNNIIDASWKDGWNGGTLSEDYDLFWPNTAQRQFTVGANSKTTVNPLFVNTAGSNFHIQSTSPAIGMGVGLGFASDLDGKAVTTPPDAGAYQH